MKDLTIAQIECIIKNFRFRLMPNSLDVLVAEIFNQLKIRVSSTQRPYEKKVFVYEGKEYPEGVTPEEFRAFKGFEYSGPETDYCEHAWYYGDGKRCGIRVIDGILYRIVDFGGFNTGPAKYKVTSLDRRVGEVEVPYHPNNYGTDRVHRVHVEDELSRIKDSYYYKELS